MHRHPMRNGLMLLALLALVGAFGLLVAGCSRDTLAPTAPGAHALRDLSIRNAADVAQAMRVQDAHTAGLLQLDGVIGTGTGASREGRPEIVVLTTRDGVAGIPAQLDGIQVEPRVVGVVVPYAKPGSGGGTLQMGTSTGNDLECAAGTLGCVVTKGGTRYFLSNNHVFARENAGRAGERIDAPGRYDGKPICAQTPICGTLSSFKTISFSSNNTVDCALALPDAGRPYTAVEACGYAPTSTAVAAYVGQSVKKCGRTSRLTTGAVQAVNVTIRVQYTDGIATFVNQIMMPGSFIRSGDSGSLMVEASTNNPVGLCFAGGSGGSFANPIGDVLQALSATVVGQ